MSFEEAQLVRLVDRGLGNTTYLVDLGDGRALAVDAPRDVRSVRAALATRGLRLAFAADTHLHADFLSGLIQLAHETGADLLASAAGDRLFPHRRLDDGDEVDLGGLRLRALSTPGHTREHLSYLLLDGSRELGVFTGGSLIIGGAARTDLLGPGWAEDLARAQFRSLHRLGTLPSDTFVWPTHGAGSFCAAPAEGRRTSTIGVEMRTNRLLGAPDEDAFVRLLLGGLGSYPAYFERLSEENRRGPELLPEPFGLPALDAAAVRALLSQGGWIIDARPVPAFAAGHLPGAVSIPLRDGFATWLGWVVPPNVPLVLVVDSIDDGLEAAWQAAKIGYDGLAGRLAGGIEAWRAAGGAVRTLDIVRPERIGQRPILDVRQDVEFAAGHVPGAAHLELGLLGQQREAAPDGALIMCGHGERASTAASLLARAGAQDLAVLVGGPDDWASATGRRLVEGL